jgi:hypothetical protein
MNNHHRAELLICVGKGVWVSRVRKYVLFGATETDIIIRLGSPDKRYTDENVVHLEYFHDKLNLWLEQDNESKLGWIEVKNSATELFGYEPIGMDKTTALETLFLAINTEPEWDDYGRLETAFFEHLWLEFQFELGVLDSVNFGVFYDDDDEPQWPEERSLVGRAGH